MKAIVSLFLTILSLGFLAGCGHRPVSPYELRRRELGQERLWRAVRTAPCVQYPTSPSTVEREMRIRVLDAGGQIVCPSNMGVRKKLIIAARYPIQPGRYMQGSCYGAIIEVSWEGQDPFLYGETEVDQCNDSNLSRVASYEWATDLSFWTAYDTLRP